MKKNKIFKDSRPLEMLDYLDEAYNSSTLRTIPVDFIIHPPNIQYFYDLQSLYVLSS